MMCNVRFPVHFANRKLLNPLHPVRSTFYVDTDLNAARNVLGVFKSVKLVTSAKRPGFATQESKELYLYHHVKLNLQTNEKR
jgi:hypothetical protein